MGKTQARLGMNKGKAFQIAIATLNLQRCFISALLFSVLTPFVLIIFSTVENELVKPFIMQGVFFAISNAAFAYLMRRMLQMKAKFYYNFITYLYLAFVSVYLCVFAGIQYRNGLEILFYYAAVLLCSYLPFIDLVRYGILTCIQLSGLLLLVYTSGMEPMTIGQLTVMLVVHLFAFLVSRENYSIRLKIVLAEQQLKKESKEADRDPLTGLINRRGLDRELLPVWNECVKNEELVAIIMVDIDHFKLYNDKFGHVQGDTCIRRVAQSLAASTEGVATVARIGGEEFLIFIRGLTEEDILELAETIRSNVEAMHIPQAEGRGSNVTISVGVDMEFANEDISFTGLYGRADKQLYKAKQSGRNRVISNQLRTLRRHRIG